jgi:hypothetical protein
MRQVTRGNPDNTTRKRGWRTCNNAKGSGNGNDDEEEEQYNPCSGYNDVTMATRINPLCTTQQPTNNWSSKGERRWWQQWQQQWQQVDRDNGGSGVG